ncbi:MAG: LL-diaminopimelate aminotransferase [Clostridia bacterium]|nr:LL-diaminopimelate aminotransferase [Clostridia bacterium]MDD7484159.1 LL-diaminopimelate aminotransferase [Clostridia bacterium]
MLKINENFAKMARNYLFAEIANRVNRYQAEHPEEEIIRLGIGDVTRPLPKACVQAMKKAADEMGEAATFRGYGPDYGYDFLLQAIAKHDFQDHGVEISADEIFLSDGAKSDTSSIGDIFAVDNVVAVCDPVYPVYVDSNVMAGRAGEYVEGKGFSKIVYMPCKAENNFLPEIPQEKVDMIYLCFPNNPSGISISQEELKKWVDYANQTGAVILYDAAYEAFITTPGVPHSIFEVEGAKTCAIEFRSFSKTAGFTGTRCAFTVIPKELERGGVSINKLWARRQSTKMNGVPYVIQRAAEAVYSPEGWQEVQENIAYYRENARIIREGLEKAGFTVFGGVDSPYVWMKVPQGMSSWEFFDELLEKAHVVGTPGSGFGLNGEGYFRLTSFNTKENTEKALARIIAVFGS